MANRKVDLTFPIHNDMTTFPVPWHPRVEITQLGKHGVENRETRKLVLGTHTGTHCDAPRHFIPGGETVDEISLDTLVGPALVLDFSGVPRATELSVDDLEKKLGGQRTERILLRFDWSEHWGAPDYYVDHPFLSETAAEWLVDQGVRLVGMDTPMPDNPKNGQGSELDSPIHKILLGRGVILIEYLCNLKQLRHREVDLIALPLRIQGADGSPVRCVAVEPL